MKQYRPLAVTDLPCSACHKGLSYAKVEVVSNKGRQVFYTHDGTQMAKHSRWCSVNHLVVEASTTLSQHAVYKDLPKANGSEPTFTYTAP